MSTEPTPAADQKGIRTEFVSFKNRAGLSVAACLDLAAGDPQGRRWVVVAPKFGETKKNSLQTAYFLAANGVNVLRFDHSNHIGESDGDKTFFTLADAVDDVLSVFDYLGSVHGVGRATLVANSLSARTALRAVALDGRIDQLVCLVGVVNLRHTLAEIYREDLVDGHRNGRRWGVGDMLGVEMDYDYFLHSAVHTEMHELEGTRRDLERAKARVTFFAAERDNWVRLSDVSAVAEGLANVTVRVIPGAMHELRESPVVADKAYRDMVACCVVGGLPSDLSPVLASPDRHLIMRQNKVEREHLRKTLAQVESEQEFWSDYLHRYKLLQEVGDFQKYLDLAAQLLGVVRPGEILLDAGCGNGLFGLWTLHELMARAHEELDPPPVYIGMDLTTSGLQAAFEEHLRFLRQAVRRYGGSAPPGIAYAQTDLDTWSIPVQEMPETLRYADRTFDKICCSLVLSYLNRPTELLKEFRRILKPGGRIVVSSMKPFCDMSEIYRDFMDQRLTADELEQGRDLLRAAGRIRVKEEHGHYQFFSTDELSEMLTEAGFSDCDSHVSFGGQAAVVVATR